MGNEKPPLFVHSTLDEAGLNVYEFRTLSHIARRGECYAAVPKIAQMCNISHRKVQTSLKSLVEKGLIAQKVRNGKTTVYRLHSKIWQALEIQKIQNLQKQEQKQSKRTNSQEEEFIEKDIDEIKKLIAS